MATSFENFVNTELPKRIGTNESPIAPQAGDIPVFTGVGLLTESKTAAEAGLVTANRYAGEWDLSVTGPDVEAVPDPTKSTNSTFRLVSDDFEYDGDSSLLILGDSEYYDYVVADGVSPSTAVSELRSMRFDMPITSSEWVVPGIVNTAGTVPDLLNVLIGASSTSSGLLLLLKNGVDSAIDGANIDVYLINAGVLDGGNAISLNIASPVAGEPIFFSLDTLTGSYTITIGGDANRITVGGTPVVGHSYTALVGIDMANFDGTVATDTFSPFYALITGNHPDLTSPLFSSLVFDLGTTLGGRLPFLSRGPTLAPLDVTDGNVYKVVGDGTYLGTKLANNDYVEFTDNLQKLIITRLASSESALVSGSYGDENTYSAITVDDYNRVTEVVEFQLQKPTTNIPNSTVSFPLETKTLYVIGKWNLSTYGELNLQLPPLTPTSIIEIFISGAVSELGKVNLIPNGGDKIGFINTTVDIGSSLLPECTATLYYDSSLGGAWALRVAYNKNVPINFKFHPSDSNSPYNFGAGHTVTTQATESRTLTIPNANVNLGTMSSVATTDGNNLSGTRTRIVGGSHNTVSGTDNIAIGCSYVTLNGIGQIVLGALAYDRLKCNGITVLGAATTSCTNIKHFLHKWDISSCYISKVVGQANFTTPDTTNCPRATLGSAAGVSLFELRFVSNGYDSTLIFVGSISGCRVFSVHSDGAGGYTISAVATPYADMATGGLGITFAITTITAVGGEELLQIIPTVSGLGVGGTSNNYATLDAIYLV